MRTIDSKKPFPASENELPPGEKSADLIRAEGTVWRLAHIHFPWDINKALEFALFKTFAVPSISGLLDRTGEFSNRPLKRYDDTALLIKEVMSNGLDSDRGTRAFARINGMHRRFRIANDDFLYVLSTFTFGPIDWLDRFGRRAMTGEEQEDWFLYWREFGRRMGISGLPADRPAFRSFALEFETERFARAPSNRAVAQPTVDLLLQQSFVPSLLYPAGRRPRDGALSAESRRGARLSRVLACAPPHCRKRNGSAAADLEALSRKHAVKTLSIRRADLSGRLQH